MRKMTVIMGSPRKNGNSNALAEAFIQEAEKAHDMLYQGKNVGKVVLTVE